MEQLSEDLLKKMLEIYGEDEQLRQAMGECGELIAVLQNYHRAKLYKHRSETLFGVMEEAVDVYFMIQQIRSLNPSLFDKVCQRKFQDVLRKFENEKPVSKLCPENTVCSDMYL